MPPEIADSDAESDGSSPKRPAYSPLEENGHLDYPINLEDPDPIDTLNFSQYLSPTQRLSSMVEQQEITPRGTGSTDQFLKDIGQAQERLFDSTTTGLDGSMDMSEVTRKQKKAKRTFSDIENSSSGKLLDEDMRRGAVKRAKTYGHSRSHVSPPSSSLFSNAENLAYHDPGDDVPEGGNMASMFEIPYAEEDIHTRSIRVKHGESQDLVNKPKHHDSKPMSLVESCFRAGPHSLSMTKSSHGGYQGYEMNFRGTGAGIDINANPFGSLSQISVDSVERIGNTNMADGTRAQYLLEPDLNTESAMHDILEADTLQQMTTSPLDKVSATKIPSDPTQNTRSDHDRRSAGVSENLDQDLSTKGFAEEKQDEVILKEPKKRGRKSKKSSRNTNGAEDDNDVDELQQETTSDLPLTEQHKPDSSVLQADITIPEDQTHETMKGRNNKRKRSKRSHSPEITEESPKKNPSSDLRLSDPAVIGVPREMYNPRPSRSRSQKIAVPEENLEENSLALPDLDPLISQEVSLSKVSLENTDIPPKSTKKQTKKAKVKRAKTSAAALLKKTEEMLSEEEDKDVVWLESKPAKVVMELPPDVNLFKTEGDQEDSKAQEVNDNVKFLEDVDNADKIRAREPVGEPKKIIIDIPTLSKPLNVEAVKPEPKKRGRKPKKKVEVEVDPSKDNSDLPETEDKPSENDESPTRQPLSDKDTNFQPPTTSPTSKPLQPDQSIVIQPPTSTPPRSNPSNPSSKKPIHSPIKPSPTLASLLVKPRVGLSRRSNIPSLLRKLDRSKEPPKTVEKKEKLTKKQKELEEKRRLECEGDGDGGEGDGGDGWRWKDRGDDGMLVEWND